jgi:hypothetical protein
MGAVGQILILDDDLRLLCVYILNPVPRVCNKRKSKRKNEGESKSRRRRRRRRRNLKL